MLIRGLWHLCDDGVVRPIILAEVVARDRSWHKAPFLLDTGADRTVLSADLLTALGLTSSATEIQLGGVGGIASALVIETQIRMTHDEDGKVVLRGRYTAVADKEALDISVLGRDVTNLFAVIVDKPQDVVCLISQRHRYTIVRQ